MVTIKPFRGWRPTAEHVEQVASPPYDVLSSKEARALTQDNDKSFLRIIKPEVDFKEDTDTYSAAIYQHGKTNWEAFKSSGVFVQDETPSLYFYRQEINGHYQTGIVAASSIDDYFNGKIKKHEYTRPKKENDRIEHMHTLGVHPGPVFLTYKHNEKLSKIVSEFTTVHSPTNDFMADDGVQHTLWLVNDSVLINNIVAIFNTEIEASYIADGHHRAAASSKVGARLRANNSDVNAAHNFFLSVLFPDEELKIIDYNRLIIDLNGLSKATYLEKVSASFDITSKGSNTYKPQHAYEFGMYLEGEWYQLTAKSNTYDLSDPIKCLDVTVLSDYLIDPILGIKDQRTDERIDFVGGIRGLEALQKRVDSGEMKVAFAIYPVSIKQLIDIADADKVMPPKSTWFEPKLRSGLVVHEFI